VKVHFDISHPAHLNFFRPAIVRLQGDGHRVLLSVLDRGPLVSITRRELPGVRLFISGRHRGGVLSVILEANIIKFFRLLGFFLRERPDVTLSCGGFVAGAAARLFSRPDYQFDDDPERKNNVRLEKLTATLLFFPPVTLPDKKIRIYNGVKEWAYLSPRSFTPDISALAEYEVRPGEYLFVRAVSVGTLNYLYQDTNAVIGGMIRAAGAQRVLLSLEKKADRALFPEHWTILKEPVKDIHSLIYYSRCLISSGDSMAREACVLGVPSYYCGGRRMAVNDFLKSTGLFHEVSPDELSERIGEEAGNDESREQLRAKMEEEWDDLTVLITGLATGNGVQVCDRLNK